MIATESKVVNCLRSSRISASLHGFRSLQETQGVRSLRQTTEGDYLVKG